jgi:hypothetical protein
MWSFAGEFHYETTSTSYPHGNFFADSKADFLVEGNYSSVGAARRVAGVSSGVSLSPKAAACSEVRDHVKRLDAQRRVTFHLRNNWPVHAGLHRGVVVEQIDPAGFAFFIIQTFQRRPGMSAMG